MWICAPVYAEGVARVHSCCAFYILGWIWRAQRQGSLCFIAVLEVGDNESHYLLSVAELNTLMSLPGLMHPRAAIVWLCLTALISLTWVFHPSHPHLVALTALFKPEPELYCGCMHLQPFFLIGLWPSCEGVIWAYPVRVLWMDFGSLFVVSCHGDVIMTVDRPWRQQLPAVVCRWCGWGLWGGLPLIPVWSSCSQLVKQSQHQWLANGTLWPSSDVVAAPGFVSLSAGQVRPWVFLPLRLLQCTENMLQKAGGAAPEGDPNYGSFWPGLRADLSPLVLGDQFSSVWT